METCVSFERELSRFLGLAVNLAPLVALRWRLLPGGYL